MANARYCTGSRSVQDGCSSSVSSRPLPHRSLPSVRRLPIQSNGVGPSLRCGCAGAAAGSMGGDLTPEAGAAQPPEEKTYTPFPRLRERDPYRLLGVSKDASFEEVVSARKFLYEEYRWHEPSRESIEMAFDSIIQSRLKDRNKLGFGAGQRGPRGEAATARGMSLERRISNLFDPTVTFRTLINEGVVFVLLACWALTSGDQSFPLTGAFAYSVYKFQSKRLRNNPEGPFLAGNPIVGALLSTLVNLALACGAMALLSAPVAPFIEGSLRQLGGFGVVIILGVLSVYLK